MHEKERPMLKARDIMTTDVITTSPSTTIEELARIFVERRISGTPVLDEAGKLVGIVTENDLIRKNKKFHIPTIIRLFDAYIMLESKSKVEQEIKDMAAIKVGDICRFPVTTVTADTAVDDIATMMSEKGVHLIPVVDGAALVGIIGKIDVIKALTLGTN
jgi:CBS-domain-containing membrane protein